MTMGSTGVSPVLLTGEARKLAEKTITENHYARSVSSGKSCYVEYGDVLVVFAIPANKNIAPFLLGYPAPVWELSRLWAPDGHPPCLLTAAIGASVRLFRTQEPGVAALVSYADPNVGHHGGVYRAASWAYLGQCEDGRYYRGPDGQVVARRKFHSGKSFIRKAEILALGYEELLLPGKHRFARGLTPGARRRIARRFPCPD